MFTIEQHQFEIDPVFTSMAVSLGVDSRSGEWRASRNLGIYAKSDAVLRLARPRTQLDCLSPRVGNPR
jgi:hypothetical protein